VAWTSDDLIASAKRRGVIPIAQATWSDADLLAVADEEIQGYVIPMVRRVREDYQLYSKDFVVTSGAEYRIPYRASGGALRDVHGLDASSNVVRIPRITLDDLGDSRWGLYFFGNVIRLVNDTRSDISTLRMIYYVRPSRLVPVASARPVLNFNPTAKTITLATAPASFSGHTTWDIVRGRPGFELLTFDEPGTIAGVTITFSGALPTDLQIGDYVCIPEETPFPQIPDVTHSLLVERIVLRFCQGQGDTEGAQLSAAMLARMEEDVVSMLNQRLGPSQKRIMPVKGLWGR
jgi:hypothetical protein